MDPNLCTGCSACAAVCPKRCIQLEQNEEGFVYPKVDQSLCVECGLCEKVCPALEGQLEQSRVQQVFYGWHREDSVRPVSYTHLDVYKRQAQGCGKWQTECGECPLLRADNPSWLFDCTRRLHREKKRLFQAIPRLGVVGVSRWITQEAGRSFLQSAALIEPIYNWVDFSQFYPREVEPSCPDKISALSVASELSLIHIYLPC